MDGGEDPQEEEDGGAEVTSEATGGEVLHKEVGIEEGAEGLGAVGVVLIGAVVVLREDVAGEAVTLQGTSF